MQSTVDTRPLGGNAPKDSRLYIALAFLLPFLTMGIVFILIGIYPFGGKQILSIDLYHQYYPFLTQMQRQLGEGGSLFWSWSAGLGSGYLPLYAYYLSSPINLLIELVPTSALREVVALCILLRVGLAGASMAYMLRRLFDAVDLSIVIFGVVYSLCGFLLGFFMNIIWLDTFALLPWVVLGAVLLQRDGRPLVYCVALSLSIWCSFLIGIYVCVFMVLLFVVLAAVDRVGLRALLVRLGRMALYSALAIGACAVLLLPSAQALLTSIESFSESGSLGLAGSVIDMLGNFASLTPPTRLTGLPNLFSGMLVIVLFGYFLSGKGIRLTARIAGAALLVVLLVSLGNTWLYRLWNAMQATAMMPGRFSFLVTFCLAVMGFLALRRVGTAGKWDFLAMGLAGALVVLCAALGAQPALAVWASVAFAHEYLLVLFLLRREIVTRTVAYGVLLALVVVEFGATAYFGMADDSAATSRDGYIFAQEETEYLIELIEETEEGGFYRMEVSPRNYMTNNPALLGYQGASHFSSMLSGPLATFLEGIGYSASAPNTRYLYAQTSPLTEAMLSLKYYIARGVTHGDLSAYWEPVGAAGVGMIYTNPTALSLGFAVPEALLAYEGDAKDPFAAQNRLFTAMTGLEGALFTRVDPEEENFTRMRVTEEAPGVYTHEPVPIAYAHPGDAPADMPYEMEWVLEVPEDGVYYAYLAVSAANDAYFASGVQRDSFLIRVPGILAMGERAAGERLRYTVPLDTALASGKSRVFFARIDEALFAQGYEILSGRQMRVVSYTDTEVVGTIDMAEAGLLYTSIPYDKGWRAYVDGEATDITPLADAFVCVPLGAGQHTLRFTYAPVGFTAGLAVSLACVATMALLVWLDMRRRGKESRAALSKDQ